MHHEIAEGKLFTGKALFLVLLVMGGVLAFLVRFAIGIGPATHLSDNYPWGLWIVFDLVWIALAGGAFATAGLVYVFMAEKYHALARPAVWMGFLSYSFVMVTLLADLGLPWHFWQLGVQRPEHSAMYEVSWCIALYVTILALEFAPTVFERFGWDRLRVLWRQWSPIYTAVALSFFVFLMGHKLWLAGLALIVFLAVVYITRKSADHLGVPIILIIAAVTFSMMHQSSLGSLFILMPDKLSHLWWSPIMPQLFFLSAIASGFALVMLMDMSISYFFNRPYNKEMLPDMGRVLWGCVFVYYAIRLGDVALRGELSLISGSKGGLFLVEILVGGVLPLILLASAGLRKNKGILTLSILLVMFGVIFNRLNTVLLGMNLPGTIPGGNVGGYTPSIIEWAVSIGLIAAAIVLFGAGSKLLPVLPKVESGNKA
ncbi:MAG: NrfD/PsrC family molybdoenzyme membrane anchor subunit [Myxococcota bacterium]|jgi:formate dehydrogenase iron-sulfur subunit